jgi:hypothetical protein
LPVSAASTSATCPQPSPSSPGIDQSGAAKTTRQNRQPQATIREKFAMNKYRVLFGAYVRMYAEHIFDAEDDQAARKQAIEEFKARVQDITWFDPQEDNLAFPSIVSMQNDDTNEDVLEGYDFAVTPTDARQYAADTMLEALEFVRMTFADIEASKRKGYYTQCPKIVAEAIAEATALDRPTENAKGNQ